MEALRQIGKRVRNEIAFYRLVLADKRTPWLARALLGAAIVYFLTPIDIIPDFVPVIGHLDDVIIVPGLIWLAFRLVPARVVVDCRKSIDSSSQRG